MMEATKNVAAEIQAAGISLYLSHDGKVVAEPASALTDDQRETIRRNREAVVEQLRKDQVLARAFLHLNESGVGYVPLDVEEDVNLSYAEDDLETFKGVVRGWARELLGRAA